MKSYLDLTRIITSDVNVSEGAQCSGVSKYRKYFIKMVVLKIMRGYYHTFQ